MEKRTYFFRNDNYNLFEMLKRIPKENFIDLINTYSGENFDTKETAFEWFFQEYDKEDQIKIITPCFNMYGKKGDIIYTQLYILKNINLNLEDERTKKIICELKGKLLNEVPVIGSFLKTTCFLDDINIKTDNTIIDLKFKFENAFYKEVEGNAVKEYRDNYLELRYYTQYNIVAALDNNKTEQKTAINLLYPLIGYIKIGLGETNPTYSNPDFKEIELNHSQLLFLKILMNAKLQSGGFDVDGEKGVKVRVSGSSIDFENESVFFNDTRKKGKYNQVNLYWYDSDGSNYIISIKKNGEISSTNYATEYTLNRIIEIIYKLNSYKDFLIPFEDIIIQYCKILNPAAISSAITRKGIKIIDNLNKIIMDIAESNNKTVTVTNIYLTIFLNIILKVSQRQYRTENLNTISIENYNELYDFLKVYLNNIYGIELDKDLGNRIISTIDTIIKNTSSDKELIEYYEQKLFS